MNELRVSIEFVRMVGHERSYLIIKDDDDNSKYFMTGTEAERIAEEINTLIDKIYRGKA
jgi:hypothetical protein